jgi:hypothetical protein
MAASYTYERTYRDLLGPLGGAPTIYAECVFVDPVADLAILGTPDSQELWKQAEAYDALVLDDAMVPFEIGTLSFTRQQHTTRDGAKFFGRAEAAGQAWLLALEGQWFSCRVKSSGRSLWISEAAEPIRGGMSGSPIVAPDGRAIGVVCVSGGVGGDLDNHREGGPNPFLPASLPGWLVGGLLQIPGGS